VVVVTPCPVYPGQEPKSPFPRTFGPNWNSGRCSISPAIDSGAWIKVSRLSTPQMTITVAINPRVCISSSSQGFRGKERRRPETNHRPPST
jgi:hypothetical protein